MGAATRQQRGRQGERRGRRSRARGALMAEINVTPFVDVMLVLLIIFMVAAPLLTVGVPVRLPETAAEALPAEAEEPLAITLAANGTVTLQTSEIEPADLIPRLRSVMAERESRRLYLRADGALPYDRVMQVMGALNAAGFNDIALVTDSGGPALGGSEE